MSFRQAQRPQGTAPTAFNLPGAVAEPAVAELVEASKPPSLLAFFVIVLIL